jgi:protein gp37
MAERRLDLRRKFFASRSSGDAAGGPEPAAPEEWYDATWNPIVGCSELSPGCDHCDALRAAVQLARMGGRTGPRFAGLARLEAAGPVWAGEIRLREDLLTWPLIRSRPRRILVAQLSDLFHEHLETAAIDRLHAVMSSAHWHRFLVLSKRSRRMAAYYADPDTPRRVAFEIARLSASAAPPSATGRARPRPRRDSPAGRLPVWPLPNLWAGVSVEDEVQLPRISHLLEMPATRRWLCFEPLLGPVRPDAVPAGEAYFDALRGRHFRLDGRGREIAVAGPPWRPLDWVVVGGETGAAARPMEPAWVRAVRDLCIAARVPFFFKRWGEWAPDPDDAEPRMSRIGRRAAGRLLDGRSWNEVPAALLGH